MYTSSALLLLRTPFQAWVAERVLDAEDVSDYALLYFTQHDAAEDRYYFNRLAAGTRHAKYCYAPVRPFDVLSYMDFLWQARSYMRDHHKSLAILGSINDYVFSAVLRRQVHSELVTLDDGAGNYLRDGPYHNDKINRRGQIYRGVLKSYDIDEIKRRIARHYSLNIDFENIVEKSRVRPIRWSTERNAASSKIPIRFFLGQPLYEALSATQISRIADYASRLEIDYYVRHPRETRTLPITAVFLDKGGRIAEDAILQKAAGAPIHLIGSFSSVLFNTGCIAERRTMILATDDQNLETWNLLAKKSGIEVVVV